MTSSVFVDALHCIPQHVALGVHQPDHHKWLKSCSLGGCGLGTAGDLSYCHCTSLGAVFPGFAPLACAKPGQWGSHFRSKHRGVVS